jgi:acyl-CoA synthetase (AMP-forming)/AMP-acid ligase II
MIDRLEQVSKEKQGAFALSNEKQEFSFEELLLQSKEWKKRFNGFPKGTRLLVALPGGPNFLAVQMASIDSGLIFAAMPHETPEEGKKAYFELFQPDFLLSEGGLSPQTAGPRASLPQESAMLQFTSGSTGRPKGIVLGKKQLLANLDLNREHIQKAAPGPVFCPIPQFHAMGNAVVLEYVLNGIPVHLSNRFVPAFELGRIVDSACTSILASPNWFHLLLRLDAISAERQPAIQSMTLGTASVDPGLVQGLREAFPEALIHLRYGLSESVGALTRLDILPGDHLKSRGLVGPSIEGIHLKPLPGLEEEPGELLANSPCACLGQLVSKEHFQCLINGEGWLETGDLASMDDRGMVHLRGRSSSFLKSAGHRIEPAEIEAVLRSFPRILEAVVVGVEDPLLGQKIAAGIEITGDLDHGEIRLHCRKFLPPYKIPQLIKGLSPFPRTPAGKPDLAGVRALFHNSSS